MKKKQISIIGLGKLGSSMAAAFASKGCKTIGVDINPKVVHLINQGKAPLFEPQLDEFLAANKGRISATQNYEKAILNSEISFVILPTPSKESGGFSNQYLIKASKKIGKVLRKKSDFHLVVFRSTVVPGSYQNEILPALEKESGKKCGKDFGLCFNPEFVALGNVIDNTLNPDFVLIGESDSKSGQVLESFYKDICGNTPIKRTNIINAELIKIALNVYVTTKISYVNMLAELCEKLPGANIDVITKVLGYDKRISSRYLKGGLGYAGPCFPRDNKALIYTAGKVGLSLSLAKATDKVNNHQVPRLVKLILSHLPQNGKVGMLGLTYKPDTDFVEPSQSLEMAQVLSRTGVPVLAYDPKGVKKAKKVLGNRVKFASSLRECVQKSNLVVIATRWPEFKNINLNWLKGANKKVLIDCWRLLDKEKYKEVVKYIPLGIYRKQNEK